MISHSVSALYWDSTYGIAMALMESHPELFPDNIGLEELLSLIEELPGFVDNPELANERLLLDVLATWLEEYGNE
jgi:FeS assembly protein IscX